MQKQLHYLGFDFGLKRMGIAVGQNITSTAMALEVVHCHHNKPDWQRIGELLTEWKPHSLVVGLPLAMNGEETSLCIAAKKFSRQLEGRFQISVAMMDERLSSKAAEERFAGLRHSKSCKQKAAAKIDAIAAEIILQSWLDQQSQASSLIR